MAGATAAQTVHLAVFGAVAIVAVIALKMHMAAEAKPETSSRLALTFAAVLLALVVRDTFQGFSLWARAEREAGGRAHCMMTYGGFELRRRARNGWELSPLVNRHYGTWAAAKAPVLIVTSGRTTTSYRWISRWQNVPNHAGRCVPTVDRTA